MIPQKEEGWHRQPKTIMIEQANYENEWSETTAERADDEEPINLSKYLSRLAFMLLVLGCLFFIPSSSTEAQGNSFFIYNHTTDIIVVAYSYYDASCPCWYTAGWRHILPGENHEMFGMGNQRTFFFYAVNPYTGRSWGTTDHYRWVKYDRFSVSDRYIQSYSTTELNQQGFHQAPFTRVYSATTGQDVVWNLWP